MYKLQIVLSNYQSHTKTKLSFSTGLTAITGASNSGKSAVFRALNSLCLNPIGAKKDIKKGCSSYSVELSLNDSLKVSFNRFKDKTNYKVNDVEYNAIKRDNIFNITPDFPLIKDEQGNILNIQSEWDLMFPFSRKESELFKMFEDVFNIQNSSLVLKEYNSREKDLKQKIKDTNNNIENLNNSINDISDFINNTRGIELLVDKQLIYQNLFTTYSNTINRVKQVKDKNLFLSNLNIPKPIIFYPYDFNLYIKSQNILKHKEILKFKIESLMFPVDEIREYLTIYKSFKDLQSKKFFIDKFYDIKLIPEVDIDNYMFLTDTLLKIQKLILNKNNVLSEIKHLSEELQDKQKTLSKLDVCPLCNQEINKKT